MSGARGGETLRIANRLAITYPVMHPKSRAEWVNPVEGVTRCSKKNLKAAIGQACRSRFRNVPSRMNGRIRIPQDLTNDGAGSHGHVSGMTLAINRSSLYTGKIRGTAVPIAPTMSRSAWLAERNWRTDIDV